MSGDSFIVLYSGDISAVKVLYLIHGIMFMAYDVDQKTIPCHLFLIIPYRKAVLLRVIILKILPANMLSTKGFHLKTLVVLT